MPATDFDLDRLLAPIDPDAFLRDSWEKQPLHVPRGDPGHYAGLLTTADLDAVIAFTRPKFADPAAFSDEPRRASTFVQGWPADRPLTEAAFPGITDLQRVYAQGKTVILMGMQRRWLPVARLCRNLEAAFHCPVHANMYLTPEGAQGFDAHFDTHEVLVLQLEGHKEWRLYGAARALPLVGERFDLPRDQLGPAREVRLAPGDLLYIPRGFVHEAFTADCASLHLTVGINVYRWADLLHEALDDLTRRDERFRGSIPPGLLDGKSLPTAAKDHARMLLESLGREGRADQALRRLGDRFFGHLEVLPDARFVPRAADTEVGPDTVLEKVPGVICRVLLDGGWVVLEFPGGQVGGPLRIATALRFVAETDRFPVRALPDELGGEGKLVLARRLLHERVVRVADADR